METMTLIWCGLLFLIFSLNYSQGAIPSFCYRTFNRSSCGMAPVHVFSYYKPGSRCEIAVWRGCPTANIFKTQLECINTCMYRMESDSELRYNRIDTGNGFSEWESKFDHSGLKDLHMLNKILDDLIDNEDEIPTNNSNNESLIKPGGDHDPSNTASTDDLPNPSNTAHTGATPVPSNRIDTNDSIDTSNTTNTSGLPDPSNTESNGHLPEPIKTTNASDSTNSGDLPDPSNSTNTSELPSSSDNITVPTKMANTTNMPDSSDDIKAPINTANTSDIADSSDKTTFPKNTTNISEIPESSDDTTVPKNTTDTSNITNSSDTTVSNNTNNSDKTP